MNVHTHSLNLSGLSFRVARLLRDMGIAAKRQAVSSFAKVSAVNKRLFGTLVHSFAILVYRCQGRLPQSLGYGQYRTRYVTRLINDEQFMRTFQESRVLPEGLGVRLDERIVEYPWVISMVKRHEGRCRFLDAGSTLNHEMIIHHPVMRRHEWTVMTLAPESKCFWKESISYVFDDLRSMPFRDGLFDGVFCVSVIEHVGLDNVLYTNEGKYRENKTRDYLGAVAEMKRVLKPGGRLYLTVPFGRYEHHGWLQQFDAAMLSALISHFEPRSANKTFFRYTAGGWTISTEEECKDLSFFHMDADRFSLPETKQYDADFAAAARGVACVELQR